MKPIIAITATILIATLSWISLGWLAFIVLPVTALFVLMAFTPSLVCWEQQHVQPEPIVPQHAETATLTRATHPC